MKQICSLLVLIAACACSTYSPAERVTQRVDLLTEAPVTFEAASGESVDAFEGAFSVPENRANPQSRMLTLRYVRFPATGDASGTPIVYLAGGPGGSGIQTAKGRRFPLFMDMREFGDVIAFDLLADGDGGTASIAMRIPEGLRDVIGRRLSRLSPECNELLRVAAVKQGVRVNLQIL